MLTQREEEVVTAALRKYHNNIKERMSNIFFPDWLNKAEMDPIIRVFIIISGAIRSDIYTFQQIKASFLSYTLNIDIRKTHYNQIPDLLIEFLIYYSGKQPLHIDQDQYKTFFNNNETQFFIEELSYNRRNQFPDIPREMLEKIINYWFRGETIKEEYLCFSEIVRELISDNNNMSQYLPSIALTIYHHPIFPSFNNFLFLHAHYQLNDTRPSFYMRSLPHDIFHRNFLDSIFSQKKLRIGLPLYLFGSIFQNTIDLRDALNGRYFNHIWPPERRMEGNTNIQEDRIKLNSGYSQVMFITSFKRLTFQHIRNKFPDILQCYGGKCFQNVYHWHYIIFLKFPRHLKDVFTQLEKEINSLPDQLSVERVYTTFHTCVEYIDSQVVEMDEDYTNYRNARHSHKIPREEEIKEFRVCLSNITVLQRRKISKQVEFGIYLPFLSPAIINNNLLHIYAAFINKTKNFHIFKNVKVVKGDLNTVKVWARKISAGRYFTLDLSKQTLLPLNFRIPPNKYYYHNVLFLIGNEKDSQRIIEEIKKRNVPWVNIEVIITSCK